MSPSAFALSRRRLMLACLAAVGASGASAQAFPDRPVRVVIGYPPGGASDILFRNLQKEWSQALGQPVVPDYRPGANGTLANDVVADAAPDGYTVLWGNVGSLLITPLISKTRTDPAQALAAVGQVSESPMVVVVRADSPLRDMAALIAAARSQSGGLMYATPGNGSPMHLASVALSQALNTPMTQVPYKGSAPALQDLIGGTVDFMIDSRASTAPLIAAGKLRALAVTGRAREPDLPRVPTVAESGVPGYAVTTWVGVLAPAATPLVMRERLGESLRQALTQPAVRERFLQGGTSPVGTGALAFDALLAAERRQTTELVRRTGLRAD